MLNPDLLTQLEARRDEYNQRQKSVGALISTLQGLGKTYNKTNKLLRDYTEAIPPTSENYARSLTALSEARLKEAAVDPALPDLRREAKQLLQVSSALKDAQIALRTESVDVIRLDKAYRALQGSKLQDDLLAALLDGLATELDEAQKQLGNTFGAALRDMFVAQGMEVSGRPPTIEVGRFEIALNFIRRRAILHYGKEIVGNAPLSLDGVWKAYQRAEKEITQRNEDPKTWLGQLYDAWEVARKPDPRVNIVECYFELVMLRQKKGFRATPTKSAFVDYSRAQFAFDLDQYVNRTQIAVKGLRPELHVAIKANADNAEKSLWVVEGRGPHDGRYIGDIVFDKHG